MDRTLLEKPTRQQQPQAADNGDQVGELVAEHEQQQFNDLEIEKRKPPVRVRFNPPIEYDGKQFSELVFDFDSMTGRDFVRCERKFLALYKPVTKNEVPFPQMNPLYHEIILGELAGVPHTMIEKLERRYYVPLRTEALKACGSSPDEKEA